MNKIKNFLALSVAAIFVITLSTQSSLDQNSRKKGPPFNDEGPGGKKVEWVQPQI